MAHSTFFYQEMIWTELLYLDADTNKRFCLFFNILNWNLFGSDNVYFIVKPEEVFRPT